MKKIIYSLLVLISIASCSEKEIELNSLVERNGLMFEVNESSPFTGKVFEKFNNEQFEMTGYYEKGLKTGEWISYYSNGQIKNKEHYKNNTLNGLYETFTENGSPLLIISYSNGDYNGNYKEYNHNILIKDINYSNGQLDGLYNEYNEIGNLMISSNYKNGSIDGEYKEYYESGNIHYSYSMKNDNFIGDYLKYNLNNTIRRHINYDNGQKNKGTWTTYWTEKWDEVNEPSIFYSTVSFDENGKPSTKFKYFYEKNGNIKSEFTYTSVEPDNIEGEAIWYSEDGNITMKGNYINNVRDGLWETFYKTNNILGTKIKERANYVDGELKGDYTEFTGGEEFINSTNMTGIRFQTMDGYWKVTANIQSEISEVTFKVWLIYADNFYGAKTECRYKMDYYVKHINKRYSSVNSYLEQNKRMFFDINDNVYNGELKDKKNPQNKISCK